MIVEMWQWIICKYQEFELRREIYKGVKCKICADGVFYPYYGVAPHSHNSSFAVSILLKDQWPENFIEDADDPGHGIYLCPNKECDFSKNKYKV